MAFSKKIKIVTLTSAARHCSVCHRYKGVKVEVYHILPVAKGGKDDAEKTIALCFDCHADAVHYNDKHPRGTKFSSDELRHARDMWHFAVKANKIAPSADVNNIYARYLRMQKLFSH
ncbi:MAG: HNH endonuclease [Thermodesulfobacteriota bacterium]|nr:HNH endonuclease [Thermodesulfobacteriota bacterium]